MVANMTEVDSFERFRPFEFAPGERVFVLTGAGVSAESGIATFRDADGLWENHRVEEVASPEAWARDPALVWRFYSRRREQALQLEQNPAHLALAKAEERLGDAFFLCTQNVDPLHERAGSRRLVHMHGELFKSRCEREHGEPILDERSFDSLESIPRCVCGGRLRPHICWFGEVPYEMDRIAQELERCTLFVTAGSSGAVYPAAGFAQAARRAGARTVYIGLQAPENVGTFDECRLGPASRALPHAFGS